MITRLFADNNLSYYDFDDDRGIQYSEELSTLKPGNPLHY